MLPLECGRCLVRHWRFDDRSSLVRFANNRAIWLHLTHRFPHPYTNADASAWLSSLTQLQEPTDWAIDVDGLAVGGIGVTLGEGIFTGTAELGYWLAEDFWGHGLMSAAVKTVAPFALEHFHLQRLEAYVFAWNPASRRVLEKAGFVCEGRLRHRVIKAGQLIDEFLYARLA